MRSRLVPFRSWLGPSLGLAPSPVAADPSPAIGLACDASVRRPLAARLPPARDGAVSAGHLPPVQRRCMRPNRVGPREGETGEFWRRRRHRLQASLTVADAEPQMRATGSSVRTAGWSAGQRFKTLAKAWRRRALRPVFLACSGLVIGFLIAGTVVAGQAKFWLGALAGGTVALYMALRDSPPWHIEKWRVGEEGDRRTAKALRRLPRSDCETWHDLPGKNGTNVDHVVLGPGGVFLLDSKNYVAVFDSHQTWGGDNRGIQLFGSAAQGVGAAAAYAKRTYARRFPGYVPDENSAYFPYRYRFPASPNESVR